MAGVLTIHYGLMGSGKTLFAMEDVVLPAVREHRPFFTNITGINLSAISWITGVHQNMIKYYPVENITDVIQYFDDNKISHDGVFILDEMKDFIDNDKAISWLESRVNVTRKAGVDFLFIAQQPKKQYIHPDLIGLCDYCNVFVTRKSKGDTSHVDEYKCQGGEPKIVNKIPQNSEGVIVRKKNKAVYSTYKTSESEFYKGMEDKTYYGLMWWQTRKWKFRFLFIAVSVLALGLVGFLIYGIFNLNSDELLNPNTEKVGKIETTKTETNNISDDSECYSWAICDEFDCKTDLGIFSAQQLNDGVLCGVGGSRCVRKCERVIKVPDGGGLLSFGK